MSRVERITEIDSGIYYMDSQGVGPMDLGGVYIIAEITVLRQDGKMFIEDYLQEVE